MRNAALASLLLLPILGCSDSGPPDGTAHSIEVVGPAQFSAAPLEVVNGLVVRVSDSQDQPLAGVHVTWATEGGSMDVTLSETDDQGFSYANWVLGWRPGTQQATATAAGVEQAAVFEAEVDPLRLQADLRDRHRWPGLLVGTTARRDGGWARDAGAVQRRDPPSCHRHQWRWRLRSRSHQRHGLLLEQL